MKQSLFGKYFITATFIILLSLGVMMMIMTFVYTDYLADMKYETLGKTTSNIADFFSQNVENSTEYATNPNIVRVMAATVGQISEIEGTDVFITDNKGTIVMTGNRDGYLEIPFKYLAEGSKESGTSKLGIFTKLHYYNFQKFYSRDGTQLGYIVACSPMTGVMALILKLVKLYLLSAAIPIVIMFFALYAITYKMTKPLKLMSDAARAMSRGDFSRRIPVTGDDEIGELAVSFNQMTNSLSRLEEMRKSFVADVSHEFKTPLTTIGGFIDGILDGTVEAEKQKHYLSIVSEEVKRLTRMVQGMLSLAKIEAGEFSLKYEAFDFKEMLIGILLSMEQRIESRSVNVTGLEDLPDITLTADKDLIHRVVYNLVDNAVKFTDENGEINCRITTDGRQMTFAIKNTGNGIPDKDLPYLFERFYKTDKSRSSNKDGTGLGLYMAKTIIKTHGGNIKVASKENEFAEFIFTLPLNKTGGKNNVRI